MIRLPNGQPRRLCGTLQTRRGGAQHFEVERGAPFVSGVQFDVQFRVIGDGTELRSECYTVTVK